MVSVQVARPERRAVHRRNEGSAEPALRDLWSSHSQDHVRLRRVYIGWLKRLGRMGFGCMPGGEPVLQLDVPELVDSACLAQDASPMRVS